MTSPTAPSQREPAQGFTLVELLVAISIMALMAIISWRGLDSMVRAQTQTQARSDEVLTLQASLGQWSADLDAMVQINQTIPIDWNGRVLRITRRSSQTGDPGPRIVAWTQRPSDNGPIWLRWQSGPLTQRGDWQQAWDRAAAWAQNPSDAEKRNEVMLMPVDAWQLFYFRSDAWTNPLSNTGNADAGSSPGTNTIPDGVRLVLTLPTSQALAGTITSDWIRPTMGGNKS